MADDANGRRREENDLLLEESKSPENEDIWTKELQELSEAASRVGGLEG